MNEKRVKYVAITAIIAIIISFAAISTGCRAESAGEESPDKGKKSKGITWKLQSYAGPVLNEHVVKNAIEEFNKAANGEMVIEVYSANELVPQEEILKALQTGEIDMAVSDDDSMAAPVDISIFGAYFPLAARYGLDVNVLWEWYGLNEIWKEAYDEVDGITWLSHGSWDPCNFATTRPIRHLRDFEGMRIYMFPTGGEFMKQFGVIPVTLPNEDVKIALQTGMLDGVAWSGITEDYTVGWADVTDYYLTNPLSGAWAGGWFVNEKAWEDLPEHLKALLMLTIEKSHYYRLHWYWYGEAYYRTHGGKLELTSIPEEEWDLVEEAAYRFWDEVALQSPRTARVVSILKEYVKTMKEAGPPYRYE